VDRCETAETNTQTGYFCSDCCGWFRDPIGWAWCGYAEPLDRSYDVFYGTPNTPSSGWTQLTTQPDFNGAYYIAATASSATQAFIPAGDGIVFGYDANMNGSDGALTSAGIGGLSIGINNSNPAIALPFGGSKAASGSQLVLTGKNSEMFAGIFSTSDFYFHGPFQIHADNRGGGIGPTLGPVMGVLSSDPGYFSNSNGVGSPAIYNIEFDLQPGATGTDSLTPDSTVVGLQQLPLYYSYITAQSLTRTAFVYGTDKLNINSSSAVLTVTPVAAVPEATASALMLLSVSDLMVRSGKTRSPNSGSK
jgi:hypothetical protein